MMGFRPFLMLPALTAVFGLGLQAEHNRPIGDSRVVAAVPAPGFPEGIAIRGNRFYVSGPASFGFNTPPIVWEYDRKSGNLLNQYPVNIYNPYAPGRGLSCITFGPGGDLYAIEPFVGIIRMRLNQANEQQLYSAFPPPQGPALPNDLVFDKEGNLYVTDSFLGLIYRIPKGGGAPQVWFQDARLVGNPFGANGIRIDKHNAYVYFTVSIRADFSGAVYRLPLVAHPAAGQLEEFHVYPASSGLPAPDGIAFSKSGRLYVALAGTSQISVLRPNGTEERVFSGPARYGNSNSVLPWTNPANIALGDEGEILVTNHASLINPINPALFAVFDVFVGEDED